MNGNRTYVSARITPAAYIHSNVMTEMECRGDDCRCQDGQPVHPPVLMTFRPELGKYLPSEMRCVARWSVSAYGHSAGRICGEQATHQVADILLCEHHYRRTREWMSDRDKHDLADSVWHKRQMHEEQMRLDRERAAQQRELNKETARQQRELDVERIRAAEAARAEASLIYYIRRESDGLIKIGTSRVLASRLATLKQEHGPLKLMAVEGGSHKQENALHRQFAELRAEGREWFSPELPLLEHVYRIMRERPVEAAPGLPPILGSRVVGGMIQKLRVERNRERWRLEREQKRAEPAA